MVINKTKMQKQSMKGTKEPMILHFHNVWEVNWIK